jgi:DNA repair protein RadC
MDNISHMDCREILNQCFDVPSEEMKGDSLTEVFSSLRQNGNRHIVDGLLVLFERYAEEKARFEGESFTSSRDIYEAIKLKFVGKMQEEFHCIYLDNKHRIIECQMITKGTLNQSLVHPRECFAPAIEKRAAAVVFIHNHPSGNPAPSQQDRDITKRLQEVGELVGIRVLDHLVVGGDTYFSFVDDNLL